jgi:hypothetical protein
MTLRRSHDNESPKEYPKFVVFVPREGFKVFRALRKDSISQPSTPQLTLRETGSIDFRVSPKVVFLNMIWRHLESGSGLGRLLFYELPYLLFIRMKGKQNSVLNKILCSPIFHSGNLRDGFQCDFPVPISPREQSS